ncbi:FadR/GntR family transcriptional regulator [Arthrobacter rhizosphaerae]|uniref:FadR/GntR family transcriptional regulator n=1 Tax=Arthrobacter rhizosphaerae TaxID=2855490 RepID=UPI001FF4F018|nr:GntR family transcriptional regulator [Arthrobacter rhizosphaerae]
MDQVPFETPASLLRPVRHGNAFEETIERLLQTIKLGLFAAGDKLPPERELSEQLGVSRATLREALAELQKAGYVEVQRGRYGGTYVALKLPAGRGKGTALDPAEVDDALAFRSVLEPAAASLAARAKLSARERRHLLDTLADVATAPAELYRPKDARFHVAVAELAGSPSLAAAVADVRARINDLLDRIPFLEPNLEHSNRQHQRIVDAILRGDDEEARQAMEDHLLGTASLLHGFLGPGEERSEIPTQPN